MYIHLFKLVHITANKSSILLQVQTPIFAHLWKIDPDYYPWGSGNRDKNGIVLAPNLDRGAICFETYLVFTSESYEKKRTSPKRSLQKRLVCPPRPCNAGNMRKTHRNLTDLRGSHRH